MLLACALFAGMFAFRRHRRLAEAAGASGEIKAEVRAGPGVAATPCASFQHCCLEHVASFDSQWDSHQIMSLCGGAVTPEGYSSTFAGSRPGGSPGGQRLHQASLVVPECVPHELEGQRRAHPEGGGAVPLDDQQVYVQHPRPAAPLDVWQHIRGDQAREAGAGRGQAGTEAISRLPAGLSAWEGGAGEVQGP